MHADGRMKGATGADEQRARLAEEGVPLTADGRVDWAGPAAPGRPEPPLWETPHLPAGGMIWSPLAVLRRSRPLPLTSDAVSSENPW